MSVENAIVVTATWITAGSRPCRKCLALNGYTWTITNRYQDYLIAPGLGIVYDVHADQSLAHPNCMCHVEVTEIDVDLERLQID